jgi:transcriptional regulator with XRE-family HTH domain
VKFYRESLGMSQRDMMLKTGIQRTYISKVETGRCTPTLPTLEFIAKSLKVTSADLVREREGFETSDPFLLEIKDSLPQLKPSYRELILNLVRGMSLAREQKQRKSPGVAR